MYCLRCGREIPDGELFCADCAKQPIEKQRPEHRAAAPVREVREIREVREAREPRREPPEEKPEKRRNKLVIPFLLLCIVAVALGAFTVYSYHTLNLQKANYRVKEANLSLRESELSDLQKNYDTAAAELEAARTTISERDQTIEELEEALRDWESAASQSEYDAAAAQSAIDALTEETGQLLEENETLTEEKETLAEEKTELETELPEKVEAAAAIQAELDEMTSNYNHAANKANFMDTYVVFVNNDGTNYYHSYDCVNFTKSNFWAYSRKLAQNYGYTAGPVCGG